METLGLVPPPCPGPHPPPHPASGAAANHSPPEVTSGDRDAEGKKQQSLEENVTSSKQGSTWKGSLKDVPWLRSTLVPLWGVFYFHPHRPPCVLLFRWQE